MAEPHTGAWPAGVLGSAGPLSLSQPLSSSCLQADAALNSGHSASSKKREVQFPYEDRTLKEETVLPAFVVRQIKMCFPYLVLLVSGFS